MNKREELAAMRRLAELEAKRSGVNAGSATERARAAYAKRAAEIAADPIGTMRAEYGDPNFPASSSRLANAFTAFDRTLADTGTALKQAAQFGDADTRTTAEIDAQRARDKPLNDAPGSTLGSIAGYTAQGTLLTPMLGGPAAIAAAPYAAAAATGGIQGFLQPTGSDDNAVLQTATGAALGPVAQKGGELIGRGIAGAGQYAKSVMSGDWANPAAQALNNYAKQHGITLRVGDLVPTGTMRKLEGLAEYLPWSGMREAVEEGQAKPLQRLIQAMSQRFNKGNYADVPEASEAVIKGMRDRLDAVKDAGNTLYGRVSSLVKTRGAPPIDAVKTREAATELLSEYPNTLAQLGDDKLEAMLMRLANPKSAGPRVLSFDETKWLRERLNERMRAAMHSANPVGSKQTRAIGKVFSALDDDVSQWASLDPQLASAWQRAREFWAKQVGPYQNRQVVRRVMDENYVPERLATQAFGTDKGSVAQDVLTATTPKGKDAAKFIAMQRVTDEATDPNLVSGLSTARFMKNTDLGNTGSKIFNTHELGDIERARALVSAMPRSARYMDDPATGARTIPMSLINAAGSLAAGAGGTAVAGLPAGAGALVAAILAGKGITKATTSELGKRFIMAGGNNPLSQESAALLSALLFRPQTASGQASANQ